MCRAGFDPSTIRGDRPVRDASAADVATPTFRAGGDPPGAAAGPTWRSTDGQNSIWIGEMTLYSACLRHPE